MEEDGAEAQPGAAARQMIRFSLGLGTTEADVDAAVAAVMRAVGRLRK
jgi:cysteine sulfinate desulfinase/cysteine desulfurase-like protein